MIYGSPVAPPPTAIIMQKPSNPPPPLPPAEPAKPAAKGFWARFVELFGGKT